MNKKNLLLIAQYNKAWMGGVYYIKNILYPFTIDSSVNIFVFVDKYTYDLFSEYENKYENIKIIKSNKNNFNRELCIFKNKIMKKVFKKIYDREIKNIVYKYGIDYIYPIQDYSYLGLEEKCINWIPDFQHIHLPNMFTTRDIQSREKVYKYIAKNHHKLILSSNDALNDYKNKYPEYCENVYVCHFLSDIEKYFEVLSGNKYKNILEKYNLPSDYVIISNQFWKHKNHITVFKAINEIVRKNKDIVLVCTGNTEDYRNKEHFGELKNYIEKNKLDKNIRILGLIPREDQLILMANSNVVIQPSLFEGWNTSVEESKLLNKPLILSDINTHIEQLNDNCVIFDKFNYKQLAQIIINEYEKGNKKVSIDYKKINEKKKQYANEMFQVLN